MNIWSTQQEAENLKKRFAALKEDKKINRATFAKRFEVPGGGAMIYQHINGIKPISMRAALAYARGFECSLSEISPRLAREAEIPLNLLDKNRKPYSDEPQKARKSLFSDAVTKIEESIEKIEISVEQQIVVCNAYKNADEESQAIVDYILSDQRDPPPGWVTNEMKDQINAMRYAVIKWRRSQQKKSS